MSEAPSRPVRAEPDGPAEARPVRGFLQRHFRALLASLAFAVGLGWVLHKGALPLLPPAGTLEHVDWVLVAFAGALLLFNMLTRFGRFALLIAPIATLSLRRIMGISCVAGGLISFLPFRLGEVARPAMLREKGKLSGLAIAGTVGAERTIDGVVFSLMLLTGLFFARPHEPLPDHIGNLPVPAALVPKAALFATIGFGLAFLVMAAFFWWRAPARRLTERVIGLVSERAAGVVADAVERLSDGLRFLPNLRFTVPYLLITLGAVAAHIWAMQLLAQAVGLPALSFAEATVVVGVLALGFAVPNAPGFFGAVQLALYAGLAIYVEPAKVVHEGAAFVFLFYVLYLGLVITLAIVGFLMEYRGTPTPAQANQGV